MISERDPLPTLFIRAIIAQTIIFILKITVKNRLIKIHTPAKSLDFPVFPDVSHIVTHFLVSYRVFDIYFGSLQL